MSAFAYIVRCNFAEPAREAEWNAWYSGPKLEEMLRKPHFLSVQRFAAAALDTRRKYLALWLVASPDAFTTPEYRAGWGFAAWTPFIRDWSRDLYRTPLEADDPLFAIGAEDRLHVASFDGLAAAAAGEALARMRTRRPDLVWLEAAGLDRHAPVLGLGKLDPGAPPAAGAAGSIETVFRPITPRYRAARPFPGG
ncbi:MAG TPA: hypothetical protein VFA22_08135 [Stellaceae bacterium]|nr:hypothetical protein [Stellaceae bacterium]